MAIFRSAKILLPKDQDLSKWAVIACDQFTSEPEYWQRVAAACENTPSAYHMILPEVLLEQNTQPMIERIHRTMTRYLQDGLLNEYPDAYVYVERTMENGMIRKGLVGMIDLEEYDYFPGSTSRIRATEQTVLERIPPRVKVRENAPLEYPHVLVLCDDEKRTLIEPLAENKDQLHKLYDFDLMEGGGHICGWLVTGEQAEAVDIRFRAYASRTVSKYADMDGADVLLAVGDGNHSLATAKRCYEAKKESDPDLSLKDHPARYALVELENIHDPAISFEAIHRILTEVNVEKLLDQLQSLCAEDGFPVMYTTGTEQGTLLLDRRRGELAVTVLQEFLDTWLENNPGKIDYIHGEETAATLAKQENAVAFLLPTIEKNQLFRGVISRGVLPRKTFSMGHAREKRYYLEGRRIK